MRLGASAIAPILAGWLALSHACAQADAAAPASGRVSGPAMLRVLGEDAERDYPSRMAAALRLRGPLPDEDYARLAAFLATQPPDPTLSPEELNALKNELLNSLESDPRRHADLARRLGDMRQDAASDAVWRDYVVQHLGTLLPSLAGDDRARVTRLLWTAADDPAAGTGGTALLALAANAGSDSVERQEIARKALAIAQDSARTDATRLTAIQVCARLRHAPALPLLRTVCADPNASAHLRMAAVASLGDLGEAQDALLLKQLSDSPDSRLRSAALAASARPGRRLRDRPQPRSGCRDRLLQRALHRPRRRRPRGKPGMTPTGG